MSNRFIAILKMGDLSKYPGPNYSERIIKGTQIKDSEFLIVDIPAGDKIPEIDKVKAVIISGSGLMITDSFKWKESTCKWLRDCASREIPMLGICFGHQLLAYALGGIVADNKAGIELGTFEIKLNKAGSNDELLRGLFPEFRAHVSHVQSILNLPADSVVLAKSDLEPYQAVRFGNNIWGLQFHPEFDTTLMKQIVTDKFGTGLYDFDLDVTINNLSDCRDSHSILKQFGTIISSNS